MIKTAVFPSGAENSPKSLPPNGFRHLPPPLLALLAELEKLRGIPLGGSP